MLTPLRSQRSWPTSLGAPVAATRHRRNRAVRGIGKLALLMMIVGVTFGCTANGQLDNTDASVVLQIEEFIKIEDDHTWGDIETLGGVASDLADISFSGVLKAPISTTPQITAPDLQHIQLDRYEVTFTRTDGGTAVPPGFTNGIAGLVRLTELGATDPVLLTVVGVTIVPATIKIQPPVSYLRDPGTEAGTNFVNIQVNARIQFFGRTIAGNEVSVVANVGVNFAQWADPDPEGGD